MSRMRFVVLSGMVLYLVILTVGAFSGRIRARRGCCAPADPAQDLRMRAAFDDDGGPTSKVDPPRRPQ